MLWLQYKAKLDRVTMLSDWILRYLINVLKFYFQNAIFLNKMLHIGDIVWVAKKLQSSLVQVMAWRRGACRHMASLGSNELNINSLRPSDAHIRG